MIAVGASEGVRSSGTDGCAVTNTQANHARDIVGFSSRGPTQDQRMKPDVVAPGTHIVGAQPRHASYNGDGVCTPRFPSGSRLYSLSSGTSHAAPAVAGAAALIRDHHQRTRGSSPSPALTKAILINTASDLVGGANVSGNAPNHNQGWGLVNLASVFAATVRSHLDQSERLDESGDRFERSYTISDASQPVRITLVWTDPPGSTFGTPHVNNLDLEVELDGATYRGNNLDDGVSEPDGTADLVNNVEAIVFPAGTDGSFDLDVIATNIAGDGVPGSSDELDQDFALVVSNAQPAS